jgi:secreted trypsin-like serine protease
MVDIVIASYQCDGSALAGIPDSRIYRCSPSHELVAASLNRDTCGGDSGGPVFVFGQDSKPYIAGVTSRAIVGRKCGPGGIYVIPAAPPVRAWLEARGVSFPD